MDKLIINKTCPSVFLTAPVKEQKTYLGWRVYYTWKIVIISNFKANLGSSSNNLAELMAVRSFLEVAMSNGVHTSGIWRLSSCD